MLKELWRRLRLYSICPGCGQRGLTWKKDPVLFEDEPPLFGHWECIDCNYKSEVDGTPWADKIAQEYGYHSLKDAMADRFIRAKKVDNGSDKGQVV